MDDATRIAARSNRELMENALTQAGVRKWSGRTCCCPFHDDRHPSAGIFEKNGTWFFKCQVCGVGGDIFDIRAKLEGRSIGEVLQESPAAKPMKPKAPDKVYMTIEALCESMNYPTKDGPQRFSNCYLYRDPDSSKIDMVVIRAQLPARKTFQQCRPEAGGYVKRAPEKPWPIYNRDGIRKADTVIVVEGEKCAERLIELGYAATTSPGGADNGENANWKPLAGKRVTLWPDNDAPDEKHPAGAGVEHMRKVAAILENLDPPPSVSWIEPVAQDLPPKGDVVDFLAPFETSTTADQRALIDQVIAEATPIGVGASFRKRIEDTIAGRRRVLAFPSCHSLTRLSRALTPGTVTILCGEGGSSKTFFLLQMFMAWIESGQKVSMWQLEEDKEYYMTRMMAMIEHKAQYADPDYIEANPLELRNAMDFNMPALEKFGNRISVAPERMIPMNEMAKWVDDRANSGDDMIIIDPITACAGREKPFESDLKFINQVKTTMRRTGSRLLITIHPKKGRKQSGMDDLAGGAAWQQFTQCILWLNSYRRKPTRVELPMGSIGTHEVESNRSINIHKARNGVGAGFEIAFEFSNDALFFTEHGVIREDDQ